MQRWKEGKGVYTMLKGQKRKSEKTNRTNENKQTNKKKQKK